jgi:predicted metal-dependent enzyme (double-stranded beta helix superfamily)
VPRWLSHALPGLGASPSAGIEVVLPSIGTGEDNIFRRRVADNAQGLIEAAGAKSLSERCVEPLGSDVIHSVTNPLGRLTAAIHVYGGDFYGAKRSDWDLENLLERDYDFASHRRMFDEANAA